MQLFASKACPASAEFLTAFGAVKGSEDVEEDEQGSKEGGEAENGEQEQEEDGVSQEETSEEAPLHEDALEGVEDVRKGRRAETVSAHCK